MYSLRSTKFIKGSGPSDAWGKTCAARFSIAPSCATEQEIAYLRKKNTRSPFHASQMRWLFVGEAQFE